LVAIEKTLVIGASEHPQLWAGKRSGNDLTRPTFTFNSESKPPWTVLSLRKRSFKRAGYSPVIGILFVAELVGDLREGKDLYETG
jgi:hypothetical protein